MRFMQPLFLVLLKQIFNKSTSIETLRDSRQPFSNLSHACESTVRTLKIKMLHFVIAVLMCLNVSSHHECSGMCGGPSDVCLFVSLRHIQPRLMRHVLFVCEILCRLHQRRTGARMPRISCQFLGVMRCFSCLWEPSFSCFILRPR